ncbi:MAG: helix-turn-helix domain-containing protein [Thermomicrobiales bacterium]
MTATLRHPRIAPSPVGRLLQHWRQVRQKSQLAVALDAEISARHLSFVESGRARPSQDMVLRLAGALDVPLREQNDLLLAAGYAPIFRETDLDAPEMTWARTALELILEHQEPYPAVVMDRNWNILTTNSAATRLFGRFVDLDALPSPVNVIRLMFDPAGLKPWVENWEPVAEALIQRIYREAVGGVPDEATAALLAEILAYPDTPRRWRSPHPTVRPAPLLPVQFRIGDLRLSFFSTITTLGTPQDITLQEIRIECFFPADEETQAAFPPLASSRERWAD